MVARTTHIAKSSSTLVLLLHTLGLEIELELIHNNQKKKKEFSKFTLVQNIIKFVLLFFHLTLLRIPMKQCQPPSDCCTAAILFMSEILEFDTLRSFFSNKFHLGNLFFFLDSKGLD